MAVTIIPNQPAAAIYPYETTRKIPLIQLFQKVETADTQAIQVECSPATERTAIAPASFTKTGDFAASGSDLVCPGTGSATYATGIVANRRYEIRFTVTFNAVDISGGYRLKLNNSYLELPDASAGTYSILSGTISAYYGAGSIATSDLVIEVAGADTDVEFTSISITQLSEPDCDVLDENRELLDSSPFTVSSPYTKNYSTISVDWSLVTGTGTRYLHIYDSILFDTDLLTNGTFATDINSWTTEAGGTTDWVWSAANGGQAEWAGGTASTLSQEITVPGGAKYYLDFTATGLAIDGSESLGVTVKINTTTTVLNQSVTQTGAYQYWVDLTDYSGSFYTLRVTFRPGNTSMTMGVSGVSIKRKFDSRNGITCPYSLLETHFATRLFYADNSDTAFGFTELSMKIRARADVEYGKYPDDSNDYSFSDNSNEILLAYPEKVHTVTVMGLPEYLHDCLRVMRLSDTFRIDDVDYFRVGEYSVKRTQHQNMAMATFDVKDKTGIDRNTYANA